MNRFISGFLVVLALVGCGKTAPEKPAGMKFDLISADKAALNVVARPMSERFAPGQTLANNGQAVDHKDGIHVSVGAVYLGNHCQGGVVTLERVIAGKLESGTLVIDYTVLKTPAEADFTFETSLMLETPTKKADRIYDIFRSGRVLFQAGNELATKHSPYKMAGVLLTESYFPGFFKTGIRHQITSSFSGNELWTQVDKSEVVNANPEKSQEAPTIGRFNALPQIPKTRVKMQFALGMEHMKSLKPDFCVAQKAEIILNSVQLSSQFKIN